MRLLFVFIGICYSLRDRTLTANESYLLFLMLKKVMDFYPGCKSNSINILLKVLYSDMNMQKQHFICLKLYNCHMND